MKTIFAFSLLGFLALRSIALGGEPPPPVQAIVVAATASGLLSAGDFATKVLSPDEMVRLRQDIRAQDWVAEIPGLKAALLGNYPAEAGTHKQTGFRLAVHHAEGRIVLLHVSLPLVNGGAKEQEAMLETMLAASEALVGRESGVRAWLDAEWRRAWEISAMLLDRKPIDQSEAFRKKVFGSFLVTVWGVAPDIVFLNCVRTDQGLIAGLGPGYYLGCLAALLMLGWAVRQRLRGRRDAAREAASETQAPRLP